MGREEAIYPAKKDKIDIWLQQRDPSNMHNNKYMGIEMKCRLYNDPLNDRSSLLVDKWMQDIAKIRKIDPLFEGRRLTPVAPASIYAIAITCDPRDLRRQLVKDEQLRGVDISELHWCYIHKEGELDVQRDLRRRYHLCAAYANIYLLWYKRECQLGQRVPMGPTHHLPRDG